jgi:hypothetical protein
LAAVVDPEDDSEEAGAPGIERGENSVVGDASLALDAEIVALLARGWAAAVRDVRYCGSAGGRHCVCSSNSDHSHMCATKTTLTAHLFSRAHRRISCQSSRQL